MTEKRKTKTTSTVKNRYNSKAYGTILVRLNKDLVSSFKEKCLKSGISQAQVIRQAIEAFLSGDNHAQATDDERSAED